MAKSYRLKRDSELELTAKTGSIVYANAYSDYGLASDDSRMTGVEHRSVTLDREGGYPYFTVPVADLEEVSR